jgi:hypothetical protein
MKRMLAFVAALCIAQGVSAQLTIEGEADVARRSALSSTIDRFQTRAADALQMDATLTPPKLTPEVTATCGTPNILPDAGVLNGKHLWGVVDLTIPNSQSCYISNDEPWNFWTVPVTPGEQITFALETNVRTYFSIDSGAVFVGISSLQSNGKYLTGYVWTVPASYTGATVRVAVSPYGPAAVYTLAVSKPVAPTASCTTSLTNLCLSGGRFKVETNYVTSTQSGAGNASTMTNDTGYFWFFAASNVEMFVKVLDGRPLNGKFWVFAGGLTNVDTLITITDTVTGAVKTYHNPANTSFQPIQDTNAF